VLEFLGLTVAVVGEDASEREARDAFAADVTYTTAQQLAWTYLRDNSVPDEGRVVRRPARADVPQAFPRVWRGRGSYVVGRGEGCLGGLRATRGRAPCVRLAAARALSMLRRPPRRPLRRHARRPCRGRSTTRWWTRSTCCSSTTAATRSS